MSGSQCMARLGSEERHLSGQYRRGNRLGKLCAGMERRPWFRQYLETLRLRRESGAAPANADENGGAADGHSDG